MAKVLVTGATGFVGKALCRKLVENNYRVRGIVRSQDGAGDLPNGVEKMVLKDIGPQTDWSSALKDINIIIYLSGLAHITKKINYDEYHRLNTQGAQHLAEVAAECGISRFVYISSIKVNGDFTIKDSFGKISAFTENTIPNPKGYYALSKWQAEQALDKIRKEQGLDIVVLRPPLIYGPGVKANFLNLLKLIESGMPLPFANFNNKRSFIYLENFVDTILNCLTDTRAKVQTFLVSDGEDVSMVDLIKKIAFFMRRKPLLLPVPLKILKFLAVIAGKKEEIQQLTQALVIDNTKFVKTFNWKAPYTLDEGLSLTVKDYFSK